MQKIEVRLFFRRPFDVISIPRICKHETSRRAANPQKIFPRHINELLRLRALSRNGGAQVASRGEAYTLQRMKRLVLLAHVLAKQFNFSDTKVASDVRSATEVSRIIDVEEL
jgi:hypothetical protein